MDRGLLQETKCVLKSLIVSCPHGMTIDELNKDYRKMEGQNIPYARLGFLKLEGFLKSLTDTLVVHGSGPDARVSAISVEKLEHIDKLVSRQKNATRDRRSLEMTRKPMQSAHPPPLIRHPPTNFHQHSYQYYGQNYQPMFNHPHINNNNNMWLPLPLPPQNMYYNTAGYFNWKPHPLPPPPIINSNVTKLIQERLHNFNISKQKQELLAQQCNHKNVEQFKENHVNVTVNSEHNCLKENRDISYQMQQQNTERFQEKNIEMDLTRFPQRQSAHIEENYRKNYVEQCQETVAVIHKENSTEGGQQESQHKINFKIKSANLPNQNMENKEFLEEISNVSADNEAPKSRAQSQIIDNFNLNSLENDLFKCGKFTKSFIEVKPTENKNSTKSKEVKKKTKKSSDSEAIPELAHNDIVFLLDYPAGSVKFGEKILPLEIPSNIMEGMWFGIFVTEVHNPYKFWFHLYKENHELDSMMQDIENVYEKFSMNELQICHSNVKPGQVCAALFIGMWHRAEILEFPVGQQVKVFFVDYGTIADVNLNNIKYLLLEYSTLKSQALRGCLASIKPATHRWSRDATYAFLDMVSELLLYAKATEIEYKERIIHMIITDTNEERDFQINDALIRKGHARFCQEAYIKELKNQKTTPKVRHFQEKYPTFDMIERGEYPTFAEIGVLLTKGIDFESRQDENILPDIDEDYNIEELTKELTNFNISRVVKRKDEDKIDNISITPEENIIGSENQLTTDQNINSNPFLSKSSKNPFLSDGSCNNSDCSSVHERTEIEVEKKDGLSQYDLTEGQGNIAQQCPINTAPCHLFNNNKPSYIQPTFPDFYNSINNGYLSNSTNSLSINYSPPEWQYMGSYNMASSTVNNSRPPPGFEHVIPNPPPRVSYLFQ